MVTRRIASVLVANRGEIAARIVRTVKSLGLRSVVVYHALDAGSPAVSLADEAIEIFGISPVGTYLDGQSIIAAAKVADADAIHPGYGFLSENAAFAKAVLEAGLIFVGPSPDNIALLGDKIRARTFVAHRGFAVVPSAIEEDDPESFIARARELGAPLLIKPTAGGGGKGMRVVRDLSMLPEEVTRARSEGMRYFGDGRLYVERFIERPRHIEVQVLGDQHGNVVHLLERECSIQRRFQKIVEESPSPALTCELRRDICETGAAIARSAGYSNAGTVEFIFGDGKFFFLEMNTRLQVEHPVTELLTGIDLVAEQLRIAEGEPLRYVQSDIRGTGHAIEFRICAEDTGRDFLPTTGPVLAFNGPQDPSVRLDAGIRAGQRITTAFDPLLAKLIVHGANRIEAIRRARTALSQIILLGCQTNVPFLARLIETEEFSSGNLHTGLVAEMSHIGPDPALDWGIIKILLAGTALNTPDMTAAAGLVPSPCADMGAWRN
jgi:acetyl/propionyl-CoA carboxylase alpha subunit